MKIKALFFLSVVSIIIGCAPKVAQKTHFNTDVYLNGSYTVPNRTILTDTLTLIDSSRNRSIPIATYNAVNFPRTSNREKLVILNPGYGGTNTDYKYIANNLAINGYFVVAIQHDLATDDPLPTTGDVYKLRKPIWDRGVKSILFVTNKIKNRYPQLDYNNIILIGHSNGGDMAMLIANEYPEFAKIIISLDNRRVVFPRSDRPKIFSIRSNDQPADPGVLPSADEQKKYNITIVKANTTHADMGGMGTEAQKWEINHYILKFLAQSR